MSLKVRNFEYSKPCLFCQFSCKRSIMPPPSSCPKPTHLSSIIRAVSFSNSVPRHTRVMSSLASLATAPAMESGQILAGAKWDYRLMLPLKDGIHESTVFKAEILPRDGGISPAKWSARSHQAVAKLKPIFLSGLSSKRPHRTTSPPGNPSDMNTTPTVDRASHQIRASDLCTTLLAILRTSRKTRMAAFHVWFSNGWTAP